MLIYPSRRALRQKPFFAQPRRHIFQVERLNGSVIIAHAKIKSTVGAPREHFLIGGRLDANIMRRAYTRSPILGPAEAERRNGYSVPIAINPQCGPHDQPIAGTSASRCSAIAAQLLESTFRPELIYLDTVSRNQYV
jgi:hypothetical protein